MTDTTVNRPIPRGKAGYLAIAATFLCLAEGLTLRAFHDPIDPPGVVTVCNGITNYDQPLKVGQVFTKDECAILLAKALPRYDAMVKKCVYADMPPHRHAAILSFTYNVGGGNLCKSSVARELNAGHVKAGCDALLKFNRANGRVLRGLNNRRIAERKLCLMED